MLKPAADIVREVMLHDPFQYQGSRPPFKLSHFDFILQEYSCSEPVSTKVISILLRIIDVTPLPADAVLEALTAT